MARRREVVPPRPSGSHARSQEIQDVLKPVVDRARQITQHDFELLEELLGIDSYNHLLLTLCYLPDDAAHAYERYRYKVWAATGTT